MTLLILGCLLLFLILLYHLQAESKGIVLLAFFYHSLPPLRVALPILRALLTTLAKYNIILVFLRWCLISILKTIRRIIINKHKQLFASFISFISIPLQCYLYFIVFVIVVTRHSLRDLLALFIVIFFFYVILLLTVRVMWGYLSLVVFHSLLSFTLI